MTLCNVGPTSKTLGRRCINVIQMSCVCWDVWLPSFVCSSNGLGSGHTITTIWSQCWVNVGPLSVTVAHNQRGVKHETVTQYWLMLAQRLRRWANNSPTLGQRLVFDRLHDRRRECTKLMWRTNERWEAKQYISTTIEGRHNKYFFWDYRHNIVVTTNQQTRAIHRTMAH